MAWDGKTRVFKDDKIAVMVQGITVRGTVYSADWYGVRDGWYIEITNAEFENRPLNFTGNYSYWKQGNDGGRIIELNGQPID